jgi:hypothetical protein
LVPFLKDIEQGKDTEIQGLTDLGRRRHDSDKNDSLGTCIGDSTRSNMTDTPVDQKDNWFIVASFDAQLIVLWNKMCLQPIGEQKFGHKWFLSTSHHVFMTVK